MRKRLIIILTAVFILVGCNGGGGGGSTPIIPTTPTTPTNPSDPQTVNANFTNYVALFAVHTNGLNNVFQAAIGESTDSSTIVKITSTGEVVNALTTDLSLDIRAMEKGPDGIYLILGTPVSYNSGPETVYGILKIANDGTVTGIDSQMSNVWIYSIDNPNSARILNGPLQWDSEGNMYYIAELSNDRNRQELRKYSKTTGEISRLITSDEGSYFYDFLVLSDGSIMVNGMTISSLAGWVKRIYLDGNIEFVNDAGASMCMVPINGGVLVSDIDGKQMYNPDSKTKSPMSDWASLGYFTKVVESNGSVYVLSINNGKVYKIIPEVADVTPSDITYVTSFCKIDSSELIISGTTSTVSQSGIQVIFNDPYSFKTYKVGDSTTQTSLTVHTTSLEYVNGKVAFVGLTESGQVTGGTYDPQTDQVSKTDLNTESVIDCLFNV